MAFQVFSYIFILFCLYSHIAQSHLYEPNNIIPTPSTFLHRLSVGMRKGDNINGVYELKKYLSYLGYLDYNRHSNDQNQEHKNIFDNSLEIALTRYQEFYGLKTTGFLDASTITNMLQPRCGVPDLFTNPNKKPPFHTISHYSLLPGNPKWYRKNLSYSFDRNVNRAARVPLQRAFKEWESVTPFKFYYIKNISLADIQISFERGDHGDGYPFRGTIDVVAHTFPPPDGRVHFDAHQNWSLGGNIINGNAIDLQTVALHELGHALGLDHSMIFKAVMFPTIYRGERKGIHKDDIDGIKKLYNL
ncbi:hypothetical protein ABFX02_04G164800 [Erythranthe guttata]